MFNKRELRKVQISEPKNLEKLLAKYEVVFDCHCLTADHKKLLVVDIYFDNGRHVRSFNHFTSAKNDYINLTLNTGKWNTTPIRSMKPDGDFHSYPIYYNNYKLTVLNSEAAKKYLKLKKAYELIETIDSIQSYNSVVYHKAQKARKKIQANHNHYPLDSLNPAQEKWLMNQFEVSGKKVLWPYFLQKIDGVLMLRHFKVEYDRETGLVDYFEHVRETYDGKSPIKKWEYLYNNFTGESAWYRGLSMGNWGRLVAGPMYPNIGNVVKGTFLEETPICEMAKKAITIRWDKFLENAPCYNNAVNLLFSNGYYGILDDFISHPYSFTSTVNLGADNISGLLGISEGLLCYLKGRNANYYTYKFLKAFDRGELKIKTEEIGIYLPFARICWNFRDKLIKYPQIEQLIKSGYTLIVKDLISGYYLGYCSPEDYGFNKKATTPSGFLGVPNSLMGYLKNGNLNMASFLKFYSEENLNLNDKDLNLLLRLSRKDEVKVIDFINSVKKVRPSLHKVLKYIIAQTGEIHKKVTLDGVRDDLILYSDYIDMAENCGYNLRNKRVFFPRELKKAHDAAVEHNKILQSERELHAYKDFYEVLKHLDDEVIGDYQFHIPTGDKDFIAQGEVLDQCVGRSNYFSKMANREIIIVFVNKYDNATDTFSPYSTLEIRFGRNVQFRAFNNTEPEKDAKLAVQHYMRLINKSLVFKKNTIEVNKTEQNPALERATA